MTPRTGLSKAVSLTAWNSPIPSSVLMKPAKLQIHRSTATADKAPKIMLALSNPTLSWQAGGSRLGSTGGS